MNALRRVAVCADLLVLGDGGIDVHHVVAGQLAGTAFLHHGLGPSQVNHLAAGDVDGDGDLDGACCSSGGDTGTTVLNQVASKFEIALNDGTGAFAPSFDIPSIDHEF